MFMGKWIFYRALITMTLVLGVSNGLVCKCTICKDGVTSCTTDGVCSSSVSKRQGRNPQYKHRCVDKINLNPPDNPRICTSSSQANYSVYCCKHRNFCNDFRPGTIRRPTVSSTVESPVGLQRWDILLAIGLLLLTAFFGFVAAGRLYRKWRQARTEGPQHGYHGDNIGTQKKDLMVLGGDEPLDVMTTEGLNKSGSGFGHAILVHRTIAQQTQLGEIIGKGRFGEVRRGRWHGEDVAVKIFMSREEESWKREMEIYSTRLLRHENLLGYIAADNRDSGTWTQLLLLTDYHANGSLFDFLNRGPIDLMGLIRLVRSTVSGLAHLHLEIRGMEGKPAIAHRDLKSKNILVKENGTACIADLGLAVRHFSHTDSMDNVPNDLVGTKRYMAPEVLNRTINAAYFESFKRADMYALGLVMWELAQRTEVDAAPTEYHLPYHDLVLPDPSFDEMRQVVCDYGHRPRCPVHWAQHKTISILEATMKECWYQNPAARLSALHVKEQLNTLSQ